MAVQFENVDPAAENLEQNPEELEENIDPEGEEQEDGKQDEGKTYTQDQLSKIAAKEAGRKERQILKMFGVNSVEDLKGIAEKHKPTSSKQDNQSNEYEGKYNDVVYELEMLKCEKACLTSGVKPEFAEFVADKVLRTHTEDEDTEIDDILKAFKKKNPQYFVGTTIKKYNSSPSMNGGDPKAKNPNASMNAFIRGELD